MIGGISFSATSVTSGLDADKPANPAPGHQYLATDTKILYVCYSAGVWVNATPPLAALGDIPMVTGTKITLFNDPTDYKERVNHASLVVLHQYTVGDIQGFTEVESCHISYLIWRDSWAETTTWEIRVNGVAKTQGSLINGPILWVPVTDIILTTPLQPGDVIELAISETGSDRSSGYRWVGYKELTIKCDTPIFMPKNTNFSMNWIV